MSSACRFCNSPLKITFANLGTSPLANSFLTADACVKMEPHYPLHAFVCEQCFLVQLEEFESSQHIFSDYLYFSSYSDSWVAHAKAYCEAMTQRFNIGTNSKVVEIASNDGYLLRNFVAAGVPVLGVEPAENIAAVARSNNIPTESAFFGAKTAERLRSAGHGADLMAANNVLAHVPDIIDFVSGFSILLKPAGVATFEFPHLLRLMEQYQFDTIYHEHFSYLSLMTVERIFESRGLSIFDVEELDTHGGSIRIYACHSGTREIGARVTALRAKERAAGLDRVESYLDFSNRVVAVKIDVLSFLIEARKANKRVAGYGAPAKGNTLLNYCGAGPEFIEFTVDRNPHKQGLFLPGTRIPIRAPEAILQERPDYIFILPWNLRDEIMGQMSAVREWGGKFVTPIPQIQVF
jgi:SAM-dependent methyltransferase